MSNDLIIIKVDKARQLLAQAKDAPEAKQVADLARAAEVYARRQKLSEEAIQYAHAVKIDAMTLMGEFLKRRPKNDGARGVGKSGVPPENPTLNEVGIGKKESADSQALADLKTDDPPTHEKVRTGEISVAQAKRTIQNGKKKTAMNAKAEAASQKIEEARAAGALPWSILQGDCTERLAEIEPGSVRLIFADPPYNIGIDYGEGEKADRLPDGKYLSWCDQWMRLCRRALAADGSFWVLIGDEYAAEYALLLKTLGFHRRSWIIWYETFGVNQSNNFNRTHRHLLYCVVDPDRFVFHPEAVNRPSDRQAKYGDKRSDPAGKIWDDVWVIPRLVGTAKERLPDFPTQLPLELLTPIVGCASDPGDLILDPFSGSASCGVTAVRAGRRFVGIEKSKTFAALSEKRLSAEV